MIEFKNEGDTKQPRINSEGCGRKGTEGINSMPN